MEKDIKIAVIGGDYQSIDLLSGKIYEFLDKYDLYIVTILAADDSVPSLGAIWARENGMPVKYIKASTPEKLINRLFFFEADYIFFVLHDEQWIKNLIMRYKMTGKHGTVIQTPYRVQARAAVNKITPPAAHFSLPNFIWDNEDENYYKEILQWRNPIVQ